MSPRRVFKHAGFLLLLSSASFGQVSIEPRARAVSLDPALPRTTLRVDKSLVLVPVTVFDPRNRLVTGLEKEHFRVFDDKVEQTVTTLSMDDAPLAVGLIFDTSGSMAGKLRRSRMAAAAFFATANPDDEFFLVEFNQRAKLVVPLTPDHTQIQSHLAFAEAKGGTALLDAIYMGLHEIKKSSKPRKALLVISDGGDNSSRYSEGEVRSLVRESDVLIYGVGIYEPFGIRRRTPEEMAGPGLLSDIAEETGGREFAAERLKELPDIASKIGIELRNRYVLGFSPSSHDRDGRYHRVQVKVVQPHGLPPLRASWRLGYYAPTD